MPIDVPHSRWYNTDMETQPTFRIALTLIPGTALDRFHSMNVRIADLGIKVRNNRFDSIEKAQAAAIKLQAEYEAHIEQSRANRDPSLPEIEVITRYFHVIECAPGAKVQRGAGFATVRVADVTNRIPTGCVMGTVNAHYAQ